MRRGIEWVVRFELPNGGPGAGVLSSDEVAAGWDRVVVLLLRDHYCQVSRERVQAYDEARERFHECDVEVIAALPDEGAKARFWHKRYDLEMPVLADSAAEIDDGGGDAAQAMTDGTPRFDAFAEVETRLDSLPGVGVLDATRGLPRLVASEGGERLQDCPTPDETLDALDEL